MATSRADPTSQPIAVEGANGFSARGNDPFTTTPQGQRPRGHRFSSFDTQTFAPDHYSSSPSQAKHALEAHLAETERRLNEASRLGTTLVEQRQKLSARLREVDSQQDRAEIGPELRQRLIDIEKEYNEVGRESARAFLGTKTDVAGNGSHAEAPFALDGRRPSSPSKFSSQATDSPSKISVPRKSRNQPSNQVHDIQFAADISTSLLAQIRQMQGTASEREDVLKAAQSEVSRLEREAEGFAQRLRSLDESEQRYKDENWNLETQLHDLMAQSKEAASKEHKLQQALSLATSEKTLAFRELDDLKQSHGKMTEDHAILRRNQDSELGSLRRELSVSEHEKSALQRKVEEVTSQNQELAKAVAGRFRDERTEPVPELGSDDEVDPIDRSDTEHTPPPSPTKGNQRHSMLESETLKGSLHHAHRLIQTLKGNVHREKTEKLELKRLLQEARDEIEMQRKEGGHSQKHLKSKAHTDLSKKGPRPNILGAGRNSRTDITVDEPGWEDHSNENSPQVLRRPRGDIRAERSFTDMSDAYQTANETEDGFETAQERDYPTENEAFQTGAESMAGYSSDEMTETERGVTRGGTVRTKRPLATGLSKAGNRSSYMSTASTSADEEEKLVHTPNQAQPQRYKLRVNRGQRRSHIGNESMDSNPSTAENSPASFMGNNGQGNQSLFAELGEINGGESGDEGTPSRGLASRPSSSSIRGSIDSHRSSSRRRRSVSSQRPIHGVRPTTVVYNSEPPVPRLPVVDSGTMTEPWEPQPQTTMGRVNPATATATDSPTPSMSTTSAIRQEPPSTPLNPTKDTEPKDSESRTTPASPPRTVWDQPLSMFSNIIPTFGSAINTTPLSAKSAQVQGISGEYPPSTPQSRQLSRKSLEDEDSETPEQQKQMQGVFQIEKSAPPPLELSLSPIRAIETVPLEPTLPLRNGFGAFTELPSPSQSSVEPRFQIPGASAQTAADTRPLQRMPSSEIYTPAKTILHHEEQGDQNINPVEKGPSPGRLNQGVTSRILGSIFGSSRQEDLLAAQPIEDEFGQTSGPAAKSDRSMERRALKEVSANTVQRDTPTRQTVSDQPKPVVIDMYDQGSQTLLSAPQIENMMVQTERKESTEKSKPPAISVLKPLSEIGAKSPPLPNLRLQDPPEASRGYGLEQAVKEAAPLAKGLKRPTSSGSMRTSSVLGNHPPLPPDHQQAIAAAAQRTSTTEPPSVMGPPLAPASAYRTNAMRPRTPSRSKTPTDQKSLATPSPRANATPRTRYSTTRSRISRRSSVSSFESELDERFNIRLDGIGMPDGMEGTTDPRMIQAITQTMIGEFLWKYTRRAGRGEMSNNRHRRFFWVHPYTRTLYWSDRDPSTAGRAQLKAKSVAIEAVRVVADDNPMPPGLHRKSLVIVTPGRSVKFTAQTSQHHETWFNALSYLLLRTGPEGQDGGSGMTAEELAEFNPSYALGGDRSRTGRSSRISLASFRSGGREPPPSAQRSQSRQSTRQPTGAPPVQPSIGSRHSQQAAPQQGANSNSNTASRGRRDSSSHIGIGTRISHYWRPKRAGSVVSRTSSQQSVNRAETAGVYSPSSSAAGSVDGGIGSGADEFGRMRGGGSGAGLENVRSCCDGRHDVGSLNAKGRHHSYHGHGHSHSHQPSQASAMSQSVRSSRSNIHAAGAGE